MRTCFKEIEIEIHEDLPPINARLEWNECHGDVEDLLIIDIDTGKEIDSPDLYEIYQEELQDALNQRGSPRRYAAAYGLGYANV